MMNLDCATDDQLARVQTALRKASWRMADRMNADTPSTPYSLKHRVVRQLSAYVSDTIAARKARKLGLIESAMFYERRADLTYERMPTRLHW
jgi:hypothetical protein